MRGSAHEGDITGCRTATDTVASEGACAIAVVSRYDCSQGDQAVDEGSGGVSNDRGIVLVLHRDDDNMIILLTSRSGGHTEYGSRCEGEGQHHQYGQRLGKLQARLRFSAANLSCQ